MECVLFVVQVCIKIENIFIEYIFLYDEHILNIVKNIKMWYIFVYH